MAEWVNAFTQGACEIEVYRDGSLIAPANYAANNIASVQEVGGRVVVTSATGQQAPRIDVRVRPLYATSGMDVRVRDVQLTINGSFDYGPVDSAAAWKEAGPPSLAPFSMSGHPIAGATPETSTFSAVDWVSAGVVGAPEA